MPSPRRTYGVRATRRSASGVGALLDATVGEGLRTAERLVVISGAAAQGAVEGAVKTAYTVIDEYMRRGREAAARYRERPEWRDDMKNNPYSYNNPYMAWGPMWPFIAPWMQAMQAWTYAMSAFAPGAAPQGAWNPYATCGPSGSAPYTGEISPRVSVKVSSPYRTEVSASVDPGADTMHLTAEPLRSSSEADAPPLKGVVIECECGHVRVSVSIPNDQPAGLYRGAIRDDCGCKRGEVTVEISREATRTPRQAS